MILWSPRALESLRSIRRDLASYSPSAEQRFVERARMRQLEAFPSSGRTVPEYGVPLLRELVEPPYRIVYELFPDRVEIVIIRHGREQFEQ